MGRKKENDYFAMFVEGVGHACRATEMLYKSLVSFEPATLADNLAAMHEIEHEGDSVRHLLISRLLKEFITPIEREDIVEMATAIDNVTDAIEDVLLGLYMFNIKTVRPDAIEFVQVITSCCNALKSAIEELPDFRKSHTLGDKIIEINRLEGEGDALYSKAMHQLYSDGTSQIEVIAWTTLYERLEACCDCCEDVADVIESVILKNT